MNELKKNFNYIEGAALKGDEAWKFERSLQRKILKPAKTVTSCQMILQNLLKSNEKFGGYLTYYKKLRGLIKPKQENVICEPVGLYGYEQKEEN